METKEFKQVPIKIGRRKYKLRIEKEKVKRGFYRFNGYFGDVLVGQVRIVGRHGNYRTHSNIWQERYRNKGIGIELYAAAIEFCHRYRLKISSTYSPSSMARRVWESERMQDRFVIKKKKLGWTALKRKRPRCT